MTNTTNTSSQWTRKQIGSILNPLAGKFSENTQKKGKGAKTRAPHDWPSFYMSQYDWLKGSHMTKVVWLPKETDYSYCKFVAPNTPYCIRVSRTQNQTSTCNVNMCKCPFAIYGPQFRTGHTCTTYEFSWICTHTMADMTGLNIPCEFDGTQARYGFQVHHIYSVSKSTEHAEAVSIFSLADSLANLPGSPWYRPICGFLKMRDSAWAVP